MGADLIAYSIAMPFGTGKSVVQKELSRIRRGFNDLDCDTKPSVIVKKLGLSAWDYCNDLGGTSSVDEIDKETFIKEVESDISMAGDFGENLGTRDSYCRTLTVGKRKVSLVFARDELGRHTRRGRIPNATGTMASRHRA